MSVVAWCVICELEIRSTEEICTSGEQAVVTVNNSSTLRKSNISVSVGTKLHEKCRKEFTRKTSIDAYRKHLNIEDCVNFRTGKQMPTKYTPEGGNPKKRKAGRATNDEQIIAFQKNMQIFRRK